MPTPKKYASAAQRQAAYRQRLAAQSQSETMAGATPAIPGYRRWKIMRGRCLSILETVTTEMETYHDQRSENWRDSERGEAFAEMIEAMTEIVAALRDLDPGSIGV